MASKGGTAWGKKGRQCQAPSRQTKERCRNAAIPGGLVCRFHGGQLTNVKMAAAANLEAERIKRAIAKLDLGPVEHPLEELRRLAGEVVSWKNALREHVENLTSLRYQGDQAEQIRGEVVLFERALDRCAQVLGLIAKLNIDERLIAIEEAKVQKIVDATGAVLEKLGLTVEQQLAGKREMAKQLRVVA